MFFIRYNWSMPWRVQLALCMVLLGMLALLLSSGKDRTRARAFVAAHHSRCVARAPEVCTLRTIQLASQLHGLQFGDEVARELD